MANPTLSLPLQCESFLGYISNPANAGASHPSSPGPSYLAEPSVNCMINETNQVCQRLGYTLEFNIGVTGKTATCFYHKTYDIAFFAIDTKLYYRDFNTNTTVDTGVTLTAGTKTRFAEWFGDIYLTNTTDGITRIMCCRLNGAVSASATSITLDSDGAARLMAFGNTTGNLRIGGTNEAFTQPATYTVSGAASDGGLIKITTSATHTLVTGSQVTLSGVVGTTEANATWTITRIDATHFDLQTSVFTNAYVSGGTITVNPNGVMVLNTTASQSYLDNAVCIVIDPRPKLEKASKLEFWLSRLQIMGFPSATNADQPNNTVMCGQFVSGAESATGDATDIQNIIDFTYGTGGSTKITVGGGGKVTNILGVKDYFYFFTELQMSSAAAASITTTGTGIGGTIPAVKDTLHGCLNEDCATIQGDEALTYVTNDHTIMQVTIATDTGAAVSAPNDHFDVPIRSHLQKMDKDQTGALVYHYRGGRQTIYQLKIAGQWTWFIWDFNVSRWIRNRPIYGAWQPPQLIQPVTGFFERDGALYGTDADTDAVYSFFTAFNDNFNPIQTTIATGAFNIGNAMMGKATMKGLVNQPSDININCFVWNNTLGKRSGSVKHILGSDYSYSDDFSVGALPVGEGGVTPVTTLTAQWKKEFGIFPSQANMVQLVLQNFQDGGYFSLDSFTLTGKQSPDTFSANI